MDGTTLFLLFYGLLGWLATGLAVMGWWLMHRADSRERELVNGLNQLNDRLLRLEQQRQA